MVNPFEIMFGRKETREDWFSLFDMVQTRIDTWTELRDKIAIGAGEKLKMPACDFISEYAKWKAKGVQDGTDERTSPQG